MTRLLLDTTFLIDAERSVDGVEVLDDDDDIAIAAITLAELQVGVLLANHSRQAERRSFLDEVLANIPVLPYDAGVAEVHAALLVEVRAQGKPRDAHDLMIAATARASGRMVVSADHNAFHGLPGVAVWEIE